MQTNIELPITLRTSRWKMLLLLLGSSLFVAAGYWMLPEEPLMGYVSIAFFGLGVVVFAIQLLPNSSYLEITSEGFTMCTLFRRRTYGWNLVRDFGVALIGRRRMVAFNVSENHTGHAKARELSRSICGYDGAFPDTYGMKPEELAEILNALRQKYGGAGCGVCAADGCDG